MDYEKLKALNVAATHARTQEMLASDEMLRIGEAHKAAQAKWKAANDHWQGAFAAVVAFTEEETKRDAKAEADEYRECP